jgi:hypothetical protein
MPTNVEPLKNWGLSHRSQAGWATYYSLVTFEPNKTINKFLRHVEKAYSPLSRFVRNGRLRIRMVSIAFGIADAVIVWQAKDDNAAKAFRDNVLAGNGHHSSTLCCAPSGTHG